MKTKITLLAFLVSFFSLTVSAELVTWAGAAAGDWTTASNWTPRLPELADDVIIPVGVTVTISEDVFTINSLVVSGKLIITSGGALTVEQNTSLSTAAAVNPLVNVTAGEIENNGTLTLKNSNANQHTILLFDNNPAADGKLLNNGTLNIDNNAGTYTSTAGRCISAKQNLEGRTSTLKLGGTLNLNLKPVSVFIEADAGNLIIDGSTVIGSSENYLNMRFIKLIGLSSVTMASTANIIVYTGFVSGNGVVNIQAASTVAPGATFTNNGNFNIFGGEATTGYGIYLNANAAGAYATFTNTGRLTVNGHFPMGALYVGGNATGINTINNTVTGELLIFNSNPETQVMKMSTTITTTPPLTVNNDGVIKISSASHQLSEATVFNGFGTIEYNYVSGVKNTVSFDGKVYVSGSNINVNLPVSEKAEFILTDVTGRVVKTAALQSENNTISVNNLKGVYVVRIVKASGSYSQKVCLF